jgi:TolB-like protein/DNA-binding winged helix-turn-helix (wHTH) protein/Tfp pilus assembly protein PilF
MILTSCLCAFAIACAVWQEGRKAAVESHGKILGFLRDFSGRVKKRSMADEQTVNFGPYRLDPANARLWHETQSLRLTPKAFQVLCYLATRPGQLVSKNELFQAVWTDTIISEATLTSAIQEIRKALADNAREPQYVETVPKRGFRFIGAVTSEQLSVVSREEGQAGNGADGLESIGQQREANGQEIDTVMPAQPVLVLRGAGIQDPQAQASGESSGIPASAGMTSPSSSLQTHGPSPQPEQVPDPSPQTLDTLVSSPSSTTTPTARRFRWWQVLVLIIILVLGGGLAANWRLARLVVASYISPPVPEPIALPLPDKPSLVVLPLVNLSGDSSQEYFSDGLTDDLINTLAQFPDLFVIARHSAFTYKGKTIKEQDVGRELGVRYVLTGSVRRAGEQVRLNVQLVDATTGDHLWVEQYDRPFTEIFALQDDLVQKLATTLKLQLSVWTNGFTFRKTTENVEAYDYNLRGLKQWLGLTKSDNLQARTFFETALALDPQYALAYAHLGFTYHTEWVWKWSTDPQTLDRALEYGQKAVVLNDFYALGHTVLAFVYVQKKQIDRAVSEIERAMTLQPNFADSHRNRAEVLMFAGRPGEALQSIQQALRMSPHGPVGSFVILGWAYQNTEQYAESIVALKRALALTPFFLPAYPMQAFNYIAQWMTQQSHNPKLLDQAYDAAQNAIALNDAYPEAHLALGFVYLSQKYYDAAITAFERAVALDENSVCGQMLLAFGLSQVGRVEEAVKVGERALSLKALPVDERCLYGVASAYGLAGRLEEAATLSRRLLQQSPNFLTSHLQLADIYSQLGREAEAQTAATEVMRINPQFSLEVHKERVPIKDPAMLERHIAALRKAGLK